MSNSYFDPPEKPKNDFDIYYKDNPDAAPEQHKERGGCLTTYLGLSMVLHVLMILGILATYIDISANSWQYDNPGTLQFAFVIAGIVRVVILACTIALWQWKRWGYIGLLIGSAISILLALLSLNIIVLIGAILDITILVYLVKPRQYMLE